MQVCCCVVALMVPAICSFSCIWLLSMCFSLTFAMARYVVCSWLVAMAVDVLGFCLFLVERSAAYRSFALSPRLFAFLALRLV